MTSDIQASPLSLVTPTAMSKLSVEACLHARHKLKQVPILSRYQSAPQVHPDPHFDLFSNQSAFPPPYPELIFGIRITRPCPASKPIAADRPAR